MKEAPNPLSQMSELGKWKPKARKFLRTTRGMTSVFRLYLFHMTTCGRGIKKVPGVGKRTYREIRRKLISCGFPDLEDGVFFLGYDGSPSTKSALNTVLSSWRLASP